MYSTVRDRNAPPAHADAVPTLRSHLVMAGVRVDQVDSAQALASVRQRMLSGTGRALAVGSVNLDHLHHFGSHRRGRDSIDGDGSLVDWMMLIDGAPVARRAAVSTGRPWPRVTGADLLPDLLGLAEAAGVRVGFLGGYERSSLGLARSISVAWPRLAVAGFWTPPRLVVEDVDASRALAAEINAAGVQLLVVGLGKPRQERWIEQFGPLTGAPVLAAFGAAADFLSGSARRAPRVVRRAGLEWMFRLALEPRRLSRRYLIDGPAALWVLRTTPITVQYHDSLEQVTTRASWRPVPAPSPRS